MKDSTGKPVPKDAPIPFAITEAGHALLAARKAATPPPCGECDFCVCVEEANAPE